MKKRILPIPLILLIPIVLLFFVVIAGIYRFSLSDEDILQKFPNHAPLNPIVGQLFDIRSSNPLTIDVPEIDAFAFISFIDEKRSLAVGQYDSGLERGGVSIDMESIIPIEVSGETVYLSSLAVSNQGTGVFYYIALYRYDAMRDRMILSHSQFLGDRIQLESITIRDSTPTLSLEDNQEGNPEAADEEISTIIIDVDYLTREPEQPMAKRPTVKKSQIFILTEDFELNPGS
ncbi:hypothetical protein [Vibrio sp. 10N.261.55.A7]|uniref:hypothetical protein n=1 Tax=Vibrio TaxID=662 RepID=UPI000C816FEB|nr:hypothetical protein [Vibrio sp. 10N.261.55.A7]PMJ98721.1 hypothetical protein BCU12_04240 [Vibrio sp. 10N.261.55.A7]